MQDKVFFLPLNKISSRLKILYLTYDGLTDPLGQSQILPYLTGLARLGHQITILSAEKKQNFAKRRPLIDTLVEAAGIDWQPVFYTKSPPVVSTLWDLREMYDQAKKLHSQKKFDAVHCRSYLTALIGERMKEKSGLKFIFDMRGFWADERVEGGLWDQKSAIFKRIYDFFKRKEKDFLRKADYTISLTFAAEKEIRTWDGLADIPIQVIPCCVDTDLFDSQKIKPSQSEKLWQDFNIQPEEFVISYLGSLGTWYMVEEMLLFFKQLENVFPDCKFLFITPDDPQIVLQKAQELNIAERKFIFCHAERKEVPALLSISQIAIFFVRPTFSKKASSPTKLGEILSMGVPVICNSGVGDIDYIFEKYNCGILLEDFSELSLRRASKKVFPALHLEEADLRKVATTYFDLQKGIEIYAEVYRKVASEP
jgi:glycosyltransferase involved in cell wall biosynthesis